MGRRIARPLLTDSRACFRILSGVSVYTGDFTISADNDKPSQALRADHRECRSAAVAGPDQEPAAQLRE